MLEHTVTILKFYKIMVEVRLLFLSLAGKLNDIVANGIFEKIK